MDRRRNRRWPRQLDVRYTKYGEEQAQPMRAVSTNVSRTGIFVRTQNVLPSGSRLRVELGHGGRMLVLEGVVMRALKTPAHLQAVMPSGMGVRFLTPEELLSELLPGVDLAAEERIPAGVGEGGGGGSGTRNTPASSTASYDTGTTDRTAGSTPPASPAPKPSPPAPPPAPSGPSIASTNVYPLRFRDREQFRLAFERDVQTGGLFINTDKPAALDEVIQVEVTIEGSPRPAVRLQARVVHRLAPPPGSTPGNLLAGMGVQFLDVQRAVDQLRPLLDPQ